MNSRLEHFDRYVIRFFRKYSVPFARLVFFVVFFWFGILKIFPVSPAGPLVTDLLDQTFLNFIEPNLFLQIFGVFECLLGILILIPKYERITFLLLLFHLATTVLPMFMLPHLTWDGVLIPSLIGQYIIKNSVFLALSIVLFSHLRPLTQTHKIVSV